MGYRYRLHAMDLPGRPDIVFRKRRCAVFVNGCFWHGHECPRGTLPSSNADFWQQKIAKNRERDERVLSKLKTAGWRVLTVWQCEIKNEARLERRLRRFLEGRHRGGAK
jgi:DNA mismatch endonuclease Vsr